MDEQWGRQYEKGWEGSSHPHGRNVWMATFLCLIIFLTTLGNTLLILLIFTQRSLRNTSNYFLVSLFMSDLMVGLVVMPPAMLNELYGRWVLDVNFCCIWYSFDVMCCSASILNLCVISLDRYLLIISPLKYKLRMTSCRALGLILATWTLAALASFLPIEMGWHEQDLVIQSRNLTSEPQEKQCRLLVSLPYALVASCLTFFLPSAAISFTYCRILLAARKQAVQVASLTTNVPNLSEEHAQAVCDCVPAGLFDVLTWLGYCNSTMNPIIYPLFMRDFKRAMGKYLPCCRRTRVISLSMRNSNSAPRLGLSLRNVLTLRGETDSMYSATLGNEHLLPNDKDHSTDPLPVTAADSVNLFDLEQEMQIHHLNTPMD
ncbi:5-hydroxytryptamine receptor 6 [Pelobates cultripes]|uniref:5-hydroxytryptamine receptor 6 n=1 Tax=Pelobates cultripes TaxID=61616 RepID=A0AAD1T7H3_PELCU|nr:5-hydroxytryptamine receptor 6 [Pelobates cultripes]